MPGNSAETPAEAAAENRWIVGEVHNFGGFFGGDTVTFTATRWHTDDEETFTVDAQALTNIRERHAVAASMVFHFEMAGARIDRAELLAAAEWPLLDAALVVRPPDGPLRAPRILAYRCDRCALWVVGEPVPAEAGPLCKLCARPVAGDERPATNDE